ncbi:ScbA/BarX family gamma-butyrolactone biosynthesis protein [Streptomyces sp. NPDC102441]|uniref:ScbA/BarX family gamma-butyrolactone biosynthesis protein n=1 Tax=Streptomyces sp. NPDC102441 TaxID=3366176 RepID=UPI003822A0A5
MSVDVSAITIKTHTERNGTLSRIAPQELVHKTSMDEVLLTDAVQVGADRVFLSVRRPAGHELYHPDPAGESDPTLFVEALRQAAIYVSHRFYAVPLDHPFIFVGLDLDVPVPGATGTADAPLTLEVVITQTVQRTSLRAGMRMEARLTAHDQLCAVGQVSWRAVHPSVYVRLREPNLDLHESWTQPGEPGRLLRPGQVGRERVADVLLAEDPGGVPAGSAVGTWQLHVDRSHPVHFDHPSDHVPGMLLLEAFRQAARAMAGPGPWALAEAHTTFAAYCELTAPVTIVARRPAVSTAADGRESEVEAVQFGRTVASARMRWSRGPA